MLWFLQNSRSGEAAGEADEGGVADEITEDKVTDAALGRAKEVAGAAEEEVGFGDGEAVAGADEGLEAFHAFGAFAGGGEDAVAFVRTPPDAATELMELGEAKALSFEDNHDAGVGDCSSSLQTVGSRSGKEGEGW